mmetsp:Transcript_970/g.3065  ORF Transcript_970/g.3065 Transcript_970/m.3065 type:complete len:223 (-) Transcript_970:318-986(-)
MSRPRDATSVASRMVREPALNLFSAPRRLAWLICPCSGTAGKPRLRSMMARRCAALHVDTNTMAVLPANSFSTYVRYTSLYLAGMKMYCCTSVFTVVYLDDTSTLTGSTSDARCSLATLAVMVAENKNVRRSRGITCKILSSSSSKSIDSILSASSSTRNLMVRRLKPLVFSMWSTRRPGVPITTCGFFASATACDTMSTPPTTTHDLSPRPAPSASNCSPI